MLSRSRRPKTPFGPCAIATFFAVFAQMVEKLKDRQPREVTELEAAMESARASGASDDAISKIQHLRDEMKAALDL